MEIVYIILALLIGYILLKNIFPSEKDKTDNKSIKDIRNMSDEKLVKEKTDILMWSIRFSKLPSPSEDLIIRYMKKQFYDAMLDKELYKRNFSGTEDEATIQKTRMDAAQIMFDKIRKEFADNDDLDPEEIIKYTMNQADNYASSLGDKKIVLEEWLYKMLEVQLKRIRGFR